MDFPNSHWGIGSYNKSPALIILTRWHVTHVHVPGSQASMPVRLLKGYLLEPRAEPLVPIQPVITSGQYIHTRSENDILEGQTQTVTIQCVVAKIPPPGKKLKVQLSVEDQLANKHKLPSVVVRPMPMPASPGISINTA